MLKRLVFILLLLLFCVLPVFSQDYVLVPIETMSELQSLNESVTSKLLTTVNSLILQQLETEKWLGIANNLSMELQAQEKLLMQISIDYEEQLTTQEELTRSIKKSCQAKQIKTGFIVGGVCIVVGFSIGGIIVYQIIK